MPLDQIGAGMGSAAGGVDVAPGRSRFIAALERRCRRCAEAMRRLDEWHHANEWTFNVLGGVVVLIAYEAIRQLR